MEIKILNPQRIINYNTSSIYPYIYHPGTNTNVIAYVDEVNNSWGWGNDYYIVTIGSVKMKKLSKTWKKGGMGFNW